MKRALAAAAVMIALFAGNALAMHQQVPVRFGGHTAEGHFHRTSEAPLVR